MINLVTNDILIEEACSHFQCLESIGGRYLLDDTRTGCVSRGYLGVSRGDYLYA